jgi:hypothetical protein
VRVDTNTAIIVVIIVGGLLVSGAYFVFSRWS